MTDLDALRHKYRGHIDLMRALKRTVAFIKVEDLERLLNGHDHQGLRLQGREAQADQEAEERIGQDRRPETPPPSV